MIMAAACDKMRNPDNNLRLEEQFEALKELKAKIDGSNDKLRADYWPKSVEETVRDYIGRGGDNNHVSNEIAKNLASKHPW